MEFYVGINIYYIHFNCYVGIQNNPYFLIWSSGQGIEWYSLDTLSATARVTVTTFLGFPSSYK